MLVHGREYEAEVSVTIAFEASHSLPARPEMHAHHWEVEFCVCGPIHPESGMVCDMLDLSAFFGPFVKPLDGCVLHDFQDFHGHSGLLGLTAKFPTCDTLAHYFMWKIGPIFETQPEFHDLRISQIRVKIFEPEARDQWGSAVIRPRPHRD